METLKLLTERQLNRSISAVAVTSPVFFNNTHRTQLEAAIQRTGLYNSLDYPRNSAVAAATANGVAICKCPARMTGCGRQAARTPSSMTLTVDYTELALSVHLTSVWYGTPNAKWGADRGFVEVTGPPASLDDSRHGRKSSEATGVAKDAFCWDKIATQIRDIIIDSPDGRIDQLVMMGTLSHDLSLHDAVGRGVSAALGIRKSKDLSLPSSYKLATQASQNLITPPFSLFGMENSGIVDPVFAGARGAVELAWRDSLRYPCMDPCGNFKRLPPCHEDWSYRST